jgi:hypothetical protein
MVRKMDIKNGKEGRFTMYSFTKSMTQAFPVLSVRKCQQGSGQPALCGADEVIF